MRLNDAATASVVESNLFAINEEGEGPRWKFRYNGKRVTDPNPDVLLLGVYRHPSTGNNLVGGINLNYITPEQREKLAYALPEIMGAKNLRERYWTGRSLLPDIFNKYYRTYNPRFVHGVKKDVMYPKYGYLKSTQQWLKSKLGGLFKSKGQREQDLEPKYPEDLQAMTDKLDQVVMQLAQRPDTDTPEIRTAMQAAKDFKRRKTMRDIERQEDEPLMTAQRDLDRARREPGMQPPEEHEADDIEIPPEEPRRPLRRPPALRPPRRPKTRREPEEELPIEPPMEPRPKRPIGRAEPPIEPTEPRRPIKRRPPIEPETKRRPIGRKPIDVPEEPEARKPKRPIGRPKPLEPPVVDNEIDPDIDLKESIIYYSPIAGRYIIERFDL